MKKGKAEAVVRSVLEGWYEEYSFLTPSPFYLRGRVWRLFAAMDERQWFWDFGAWDDLIEAVIEEVKHGRSTTRGIH